MGYEKPVQLPVSLKLLSLFFFQKYSKGTLAIRKKPTSLECPIAFCHSTEVCLRPGKVKGAEEEVLGIQLFAYQESPPDPTTGTAKGTGPNPR